MQDFINLYERVAPKDEEADLVKQNNAVFKNLRALGYRYDLKKEVDIKEEHVELDTLPRYILSKDESFYEMLFSILEKV